MAEEELEGLLREVARAPDVPVPAQPGTRVGRFEIVQQLGAGGMGVVHEAIDPTLGRRVAIKLLRSGEGDAARLLREAQALARLAHPNVVTVFDAGRDGDHVYIAMELVGGKTARAWRDAGRSLREILDVYRQAAAGLAAAHRSGLVHRDVKPENILVGDDGRVRVTDFGLAAAMGEVAEGELPEGAEDSLQRTLTQTGTVLGTPPYMPPEAFERGEIDARSDQWSLCVSLWEAIAGTRPFTGQSIGELAVAIRAGKPALDRLPARVRPALARGLAVDPAARWPSVEALVEALDRRRVPRAVFAAGGIAAISAAAVVMWPRGHATKPKPAAVAATPVKRTLGGCPYMPAFVDDDTIVFDDGNGDLEVIRGTTAAVPLVTVPGRNDWRASRGRKPGEAVFVASAGSHNQAGFVDVATGAVEIEALEGGSFAFGGGALFYSRTDLPEIRRVAGGEDAPLFQLPSGRWPYTVAVSADGRRTAVTTATDRGSPTICLGEGADVTCLERDDGIRGRAAFSPDGGTLYYQTSAGIRRRTLATEDDTLWLPGVEALGGIDVSPSGRTLVFSDDRPRGVEVAPVDALDAPVVVASIIGPMFAGGRWFYTRTGARGVELVAQAVDGTVVVLATMETGPNQLWVDAEGKHVAFDVDGDEPGIYVVDARAYPPVRVTTSESDSNPVWTADGKLAFTRWNDKMQASVVIADPELGVKDDATRVAAHPSPRVTLGRVPTTGELVLAGLEEAIYLWDPVTGHERTIDVSGLEGRPILQVATAPDGRTLVALTNGEGYELWRIPLVADAGPTARVMTQPDCATLDRPAFDADGKLYAVTAPWRGDVYTVDLE